MEREIKEIAKRKGVPPSIVEKDYVISVILRQLWSAGGWRKLVFKGGTALRKVYFPDYRFSEDLDFNFRGESVEEVMRALSTLRRFGKIEFEEIEIRERVGRKYHRGKAVGYELRVPFYFLRKVGVPAKIRIDITLEMYEKMVLEPVERSINHEYSDYEAFSRVKVLAYSLEEIMAEKIRTIFQRVGRPRDIYDIWYLSSRTDMETVLSIVEKKFAVKGVPFLPEKVRKNENVYRNNWKHLSALIGKVPDFNEVWATILDVCEAVDNLVRERREK